MQKHHGLPVDGEENAGDAIVQPDSHFPDIPAQMIDQGHAQGPAKLDRLDVLADGLPVNGRQILQPLANRLSTGIGAEEANVQHRFHAAHRTNIGTFTQALRYIQFRL